MPTVSVVKGNFSEEEWCLFARRYEEGDDIADTRYWRWLHQRKTISADFANSPPLHQCSHSVVSLTAHDQQHSDDAISQSQDEFQEVHNINNSEQGKILKAFVERIFKST